MLKIDSALKNSVVKQLSKMIFSQICTFYFIFQGWFFLIATLRSRLVGISVLSGLTLGVVSWSLTE